MPLGPGHTLDAVRVVEAVGVSRREDVFWALHAALVSRPEHREVFRRAFDIFWRDPFGAEQALAALLPTLEVPGSRRHRRPGTQRAADEVQQRLVTA